MSDETPLPGLSPIVASELRRVEEQCTGRHERTGAAIGAARVQIDKNTAARIELTGTSGKNGMVGMVRDDLDEVRAEQKSQRQLIIRLMLAVAGAAMGGAGIGHVVLKAFQ